MINQHGRHRFLSSSPSASSARRRSHVTRNRACPDLEAMETRMLLTSVVVNNATDSPVAGKTDLRQAIALVNASSSASNSITFPTLFNLGRPSTIDLNSALPQIVKPVSIDGTQAGLASPSIQIVNNYDSLQDNGISFGSGSDGSSIDALSINGFFNGILVNSNNVQIEGDYLGTDLTGTSARPNIEGDPCLVLPQISQAKQSLATSSRATFGDGIASGSASSSKIINNTIGTNKDGTAALPNGDGIDTSFFFRDHQRQRDLRQCCLGVNLDDGTKSCQITGNLIGTNRAGTAAIPNGVGITTGENGFGANVSLITIGGISAGDGNLISGNTHDGIDISTVNNSDEVGMFLVQGKHYWHQHGRNGCCSRRRQWH